MKELGTFIIFLIGMTLIFVMIVGCAATPAVVGHCELPEALAQKSIPLDAVIQGLTLEQQHVQWAKDRAHAAKSDHHSDALIDYVQGNCQ